MSNLPEQPAWESGIHQLEESDRAKAGPGGVLNIPSTQLANRTSWLRAQVESVIDYREYTFFKTESDPDGTISGLDNTPAGKVFRVIQGPGDNYSFIYYLNQSGIAKELTTLIGNGAFDYLLGLIDALQLQFAPLQESPDALFDIVSANGIRPFKVDDDDGATTLSLIARLLTGNSGLNFGGSIIDNNAPDG